MRALTVCGTLAAFCFVAFAPAESTARTYKQCISTCKNQSCREDCENEINQQNARRRPPGTIEFKCRHNRRNSEQDCTR
jgi:hypothetical protein